MSINKFKVLLKVVELGSLTQAAEVMGFTQSGVSHMISDLEDEFGFSLLIRNRSGAKLTTNGEEMLKTIREILKWNEHLEQQVASIHGIELGTIHIGTFTSVGVHWRRGLFRIFSGIIPISRFVWSKEITGKSRIGSRRARLIAGSCHFQRRIHSMRFLCIKTRCLYCALEHPLSSEDSISLSQIENEPFIMPSQGSDYDVNRMLVKARIKPDIKYTLGDDYAIMAMVEKGLGISILPELVFEGTAEYTADRIEGEELQIARHCRNSMREISPATKRFLNYVKSYPKL